MLVLRVWRWRWQAWAERDLPAPNILLAHEADQSRLWALPGKDVVGVKNRKETLYRIRLLLKENIQKYSEEIRQALKTR